MNRIRTVGVIGAIVVGAMLSAVGVTAASAAPASASVATSTSVSGLTGAVSGGSVRLAGGVATGAPASDGISTNGVPIGPIINWIKKNASSLITPMKNAVKKGFTAFKNWWAGVAGWIKAAINAIASMTIQALFDALWNYFF